MRLSLLNAFAFIIAISAGNATAETTSTATTIQPGDTIISNGRIIDGTGAPAREADVLVRDGRIVAIDELGDMFPAIAAVIGASGKVVTPGFIDTHAHGDPVETPEFHNFLAMGVTTICLGQDGSSHQVGSLSQWFNDISTTRPGPNVLTYIGHGTVRNESGIKLSTDPSAEQLTAMAELVEKGLQQGAWGLTTGLEYQPGMFAAANELAVVAQPVGNRGLTVMSHMRNEDDDQLTSSITELVEQCRAAGAHAHISHLKSVYGKGSNRAEEILSHIEAARKSGVRVTADIYPYTASHTGLAILFPRWALPPNSYKDVLANRRDELVQFLHDKVARRNGPEATLLGTGENAGKTLARLAEERGKPYAEVLADLGPRGGSAAYFVMNEDLQSRLLVADGINICSDGSPTMRHPRGYGSFAKIIRKFVNEDKLLTLEQAIHKMSGLPAQTVGLNKHNRGILKPGHAADILIFDPAKIKDTATFEEPHQLANGFDTILINGKIIRQNGEFKDQRHGQVLKRPE